MPTAVAANEPNMCAPIAIEASHQRSHVPNPAPMKTLKIGSAAMPRR
jgi:hypothetical protein